MSIILNAALNYFNKLYGFIYEGEKYKLNVYAGSVGVPVVGYGVVLLARDKNDNYVVRGKLGIILEAAGLALNSIDRNRLGGITTRLNTSNMTAAAACLNNNPLGLLLG